MRWIKLNNTILEHRVLFRLARRFGLASPDMALGMVARWFFWLDSQGDNGGSRLYPEDVERVVRSGDYAVTQMSRCERDAPTPFCDTLLETGWIELEEDGTVTAVDYAKHNGPDAKKAAQAVERQRKARARNAAGVTGEAEGVTQMSRSQRDKSVTREEKRIYKEKTALTGSLKESEPEPGALPAVAEQDMNPERQQQQPEAVKVRKQVPLPASADEVADLYAGDMTLRMGAGDKLECARCFFDDQEGCGWTDRRSGQPIADWRGVARLYARKWAAHMGSNPGARGGVQAQKPTRNTSAMKGHEHEYDF